MAMHQIRRLSSLSIIAVIIALIAGCDSDERINPSGAIECSIIELITSPEDYDGKLVEFGGYLQIEFEIQTISAHEVRSMIAWPQESIWVNFSNENDKSAKAIMTSGKGVWARIRGVFHTGPAGHLRAYTLSLDQAEIVYFRDPKDGKIQ